MRGRGVRGRGVEDVRRRWKEERGWGPGERVFIPKTRDCIQNIESRVDFRIISYKKKVIWKKMNLKKMTSLTE